MKSKPLVSIITPCYNGESYVHRLLDSVLNQTYDNIEFIFVNDGSTDRTEEIALSYKEKFENKGIAFTYIFQENAGQAAAVNKGLKLFKGDYLTWPDSDDWMPENLIEEQVRYLSENTHKGFVMNKCQYVSGEDFETVIKTVERKNKDKCVIFDDLIIERDIYWAAGAIMVRAESFLDVNPEREIFSGKGGQNWQMLLPLAHKYECGFLDYPVYNILDRVDSHSRRRLSSKEIVERTEEHRAILIGTVEKVALSDDERAEYVRIIKDKLERRLARQLFSSAFREGDRVLLKYAYEKLCMYEKPSFKLKVKYIVGRNKILYWIYKKIRK